MAPATQTSKYCTPIINPQGPGGLASGGRTNMILNAMQLGRHGLMDSLPMYQSTKAHINIGILTGLTETTNADGSTPAVDPRSCCDDFPTAGLLTMCEWAGQWGLFGRQSRIYSLCDDDDGSCDKPIDVINSVLSAGNAQSGMGGSNDIIDNEGGSNDIIDNERGIMNSAYQKAMFELAATFKRDMAGVYFSGNPGSGGSTIRPFKGLASIINTGYRDAVSGKECPHVDPIVISAADYLGTDKACENAAGFVSLITGLVRNSKERAFEMGLGIVDGVFIGPSWMRNCLIDMWVCGYGGCNCCGESMGNTVVVQSNTETSNRMRDDMMMGSYIVVDGMEVPWIVDNADDYGTYDQVTGERSGRLFYTPITAMNGSTPLFYQQYRPWNTTEMTQVMQQWGGGDFGMPQQSPNGAWLLYKKPPQNLCLQIAGVTKRRLAHHAPFLAFQVTDITCCTFQVPTNTHGGGRTEGPLPFPTDGIPGSGDVQEIDLDSPFCVTLKVDGVPTPTTIYCQPNGCYVLEDGCEIDIGDICPVEGACEVVFSPTLSCYNPWDGPSVEVYLQDDGTYNTLEDGTGDVIDTSGGTICEGACPVVFAPVLYCVNPHNAPPFEAYSQEDGTFNTAADGSGDTVSVASCDLVEGACPTGAGSKEPTRKARKTAK